MIARGGVCRFAALLLGLFPVVTGCSDKHAPQTPEQTQAATDRSGQSETEKKNVITRN